jgi:hypothetical protein
MINTILSLLGEELVQVEAGSNAFCEGILPSAKSTYLAGGFVTWMVVMIIYGKIIALMERC